MIKPFLRKGNEFNIVDQSGKKSYNIPETVIPQFFEMLEKCRNDKLSLSFFERQLEYSGIMLDFDIKQKQSQSQLTDGHIYNLIKGVLKHIIKVLNVQSLLTNVLVLRKTNQYTKKTRLKTVFI